MITEPYHQYDQAILDKSAAGQSPLYVAVRTTGVFCRPGYDGRPKPENCERYESAEQALLAGYRPCKRCRPLSHPLFTSKPLQVLVTAVEASPERPWMDSDFDQISPHAGAASLEFQKRFGMSLVGYAGIRRLAVGKKQQSVKNRIIV